MNNKTKEQNICLEKLRENNYIGTWIAATGSGKTKLGVDLANEICSLYENPSILIIVPTSNLRDNEWEREIKLWHPNIRKYIRIECIQTVYKFEDKEYDLVICDEVHTQLTKNYGHFFLNNKYKHILGLTATVEDDDKLEFLKKYMPIIHETSVNRALELGLITPFIIYNVPVKLTKEESSKLRSINYLYGSAERELGGRFTAFDRANKYKNDKNHPLYKWSMMFWVQMMKRKTLLQNAHNKISVTKQIVDMNKGKKTLIFCKTASMAEQIAKEVNGVSYHTNSEFLSKKQAEENLLSYINGKCDILVSVDALSAGLNVPKSEIGICVTGSSKKLEDTQRRGRILRIDESNPDKIGLYYNLYIGGSQEEKWVNKRQESLSKEYIKLLEINE